MRHLMKKLLAILLVLALALPMGAAAKSFPDTAGLPCETAVSFLNDLGILEGKSEAGFEPAASLTRAEMATIIVRMLGMEGMAKGTDRFMDVPSTHWAYNTVSAAYELGFVNGMDETHFAPDDVVTKAQAVKMLVCALGYEVQAEAMGGYPTGYLSKGTQLELTKGTGSADEMNRGIMAIMVKNAVECPLLQRVSYGGDTLSFTESENKTVLTEYLNVDTYKGRITATHTGSLTGERVKAGSISLDGKIFEVGETDAEAKFGQKVTLYAKEETAISVISANNTEILSLSADEIEKFENNILYYEEEKVDLKGAKFVFNGDPAVNFTKPESGRVTVIFESGDPAVVITEAYENFVAKRVTDGTVYFKEGSAIDVDGNAKTMLLEKQDGTKIETKTIKEWNILSVVAGTGATKIIVSDKKVAGTVSEMSEDTVKIGDAEYTVSPSLLKSTKLTKPALGLAGVFYLDFADCIAAVDNSAKAQEEAEASAGSAKYGYLVAAAIKKGMDGTPQFKLYTEEGKMHGFDMADRMEVVNGIAETKSVSSSDFTTDGTTVSVLGRTLSPQLVRYTEKDGKLTKLELAANASESPQLSEREARLNVFSLDRTIPSATYYGGRWNTFSTKEYVSSKTVIFNIPSVHSTDEKDYAIMTRSQMGVGFVVQYSNVEVYDEDQSGALGAVIVHKEVKDYVSDTDPVGLITSISTGLDAEGNAETRLKIANSKGVEAVYSIASDLEIAFGVEDKMTTKDKTATVDGTIITDKTKDPETVNGELKESISPSALRAGDVVAFVETNNVIQKMAVRFRANSPIMKEIGIYAGEPYYSPVESWLYTDGVFWFGEVVEVGDELLNYKTLAHQQNGEYDTVKGPFWTRMEPFDGVKIMEFNMKTGTFKSITKDAINVGDKVFGYRITVNPQFIIVYKDMDK